MKMHFQIFTLCLGFVVLYLSAFASSHHCKIEGQFADCSHLRLLEVPSDLPDNITILNLSHNQLRRLPSSILSKYRQLQNLRAGYNVIPKLEEGLCKSLPFLQVLNLEHNQLSHLILPYFLYCANLTELYLQFNRVKEITAEPFKSLQKLEILDMSRNILVSAKLGSEQQLQNLQELVLSGNKLPLLKANDFAILKNSTLHHLDLSSNRLMKFEKDCFRIIGSLRGLWLENTVLTNLTEELVGQLSGTDITELSLRNTHLKISQTTFAGLQGTNLTSLDLSNNGINRLEDNSFKWLQYLEYLNMENNKVKRVTAHMFAGLMYLKSLNLKKCLTEQNSPTTGGSTIEAYSFQWLKSLEYLNLEDNTIVNIAPQTFTGLTSLKYLSLYNSSANLKIISNLTFMSLADSPLVVLNLTRTRISKLESGAFSSFRNLKKLDLGINSIYQPLTGEEFQGLDKIEEIYLSYNTELTLKSSSFDHVPTMKVLMLSRTKIVNLNQEPSPFHGLRNLTVLDLANNNLANLGRDVFSGLQNLQVLKLQHNNLARLWKKVYPGGPVLYLNPLKELWKLNLQSCGLDEIPGKAFQGLAKLVELDLSSNNLNILPQNIFNDLRSLSILRIPKNLVTSVDREIFESVFDNLTTLYMAFNPFDCTCESIAWFVSWLNKTNSSIPGLNNQYICNTPPKYHNNSVVTFDISPCKDRAPFETLSIISSSIVLIFMFTVLVVQFQGWRLEFYWNISVNRMFGFRETDRTEIKFDYDAYIIHAKHDSDWVEKNLIPLEESDQSGFQFCLEERDSEGGISELESIVSNITQSRKIIFVVTQELLKDPWCRRFKIHHAMQQVIEQSRDAMILIFVEDIPDYKLNHMLRIRRGMFKSHCILTWPAHREREAAFLQKLMIAIGSSNRVQ
ncbi:toll-like receptor 3 [Callorhinchus milii]|uniref:toll-like receptor 3 n=1 Tax=Callorhinchus milii TaxID=7868 RepID=UPI001C3F8543|nr:toll-like receptor 3 [Callorhinchus milii]